jgi:hypothetical protein
MQRYVHKLFFSWMQPYRIDKFTSHRENASNSSLLLN